MKLDVNFENNTALLQLDDGFELVLAYNELEELEQLIYKEVNNDR